MANVGQQLSQPQNGWKRYSALHPSISYLGEWERYVSTNYQFANNVAIQSVKSGDSFTFKFTGTKLLIKCYGNTDTSGFSLIVDGVNYGNIKTAYGVISSVVVFEKTNLSDQQHNVEIKVLDKSVITNSTLTRVLFDAIDIDISKFLETPAPLPLAIPCTTGKLCNTLDEMDIGDYIVWKRDGNVHSFGGNIDGYTEIPVTGVASSSLPTKHFHYAIKVDTGLLISDRVTEHTISWDTLNSQKRIQGLPTTISGVSGIVRSLTGGVAYADENGNMSMNALGSEGCFPINNEWDKYVNNFPLSMVQTGKTLEDIWHHVGMLTWTQDTPSRRDFRFTDGQQLSYDSSFRATRGIWQSAYDKYKDILFSVSSKSSTNHYFRPVFEWREV